MSGSGKIIDESFLLRSSKGNGFTKTYLTNINRCDITHLNDANMYNNTCLCNEKNSIV